MHQIIALNRRAVALSDGAVADVPGAPPGDAGCLHLCEDIGRVLVNGEDLPDAGLPGLGPERADGEFALCEIILPHHVVHADGVSRCSVGIYRAGILIHIAVVQNIMNIINQISVCFRHFKNLS